MDEWGVFNGRQLSCSRCCVLLEMLWCRHTSARILKKKKKKSCNVKKNNQWGRQIFFSDCVFYDCKWGTAVFFWGGTDIFTFLYLNSFFVTHCEVGRDAQREACHQLSLMFATWHILYYYIGFVFILSWKAAVAHQSNKTVLLNDKDRILQKRWIKRTFSQALLVCFSDHCWEGTVLCTQKLNRVKRTREFCIMWRIHGWIG